ncbi:MAG: histidine phosphatase family protein [Spirochaetales bacterium]|jgi:phosphohistidine phosphatase|nr:histidine phosphatase family protein [Spirochaetales bacterium]
MKYLILLRHGPAGKGETDFARKLTPQGQEAALARGQLLKEKLAAAGYPGPDLILSSPAVRAFETASRIQEGLGKGGPKIKVIRDLYLPGPDLCLLILREQKEAPCLILCSHNPGISDLGKTLFPWQGNLPPLGVLAGRLGVDSWEALSPGGGFKPGSGLLDFSLED